MNTILDLVASVPTMWDAEIVIPGVFSVRRVRVARLLVQ
jgi:hypothetical protein